MTPLLYHTAVGFLREKGIDFHDLGGAVSFNVAVSDERDLSILVIDLSERMETGEGFRVLVPDVITFPAGADAVRMANRLNSRGDMAGKFTVADDMSLRFALESVFPEDGDYGPESVQIALERSMDAVTGFYAIAEEATNGNADDWDIGDILNP